MTIANYIYIIVISGYYTKEDWQKWADEEILKRDEVDDWIYQIATAKDVDEVRSATYYPRLEECYFCYNKFSREDAIVGFYYMLYKENRMSLYELISKLSDEDDISNGSSIRKRQNFYEMFNQLNKINDLDYRNALENKIKELFEPLVKIAKEQKRILEAH